MDKIAISHAEKIEKKFYYTDPIVHRSTSTYSGRNHKLRMFLGPIISVLRFPACAEVVLIILTLFVLFRKKKNDKKLRRLTNKIPITRSMENSKYYERVRLTVDLMNEIVSKRIRLPVCRTIVVKYL